jgi:hypothetical protein
MCTLVLCWIPYNTLSAYQKTQMSLHNRCPLMIVYSYYIPRMNILLTYLSVQLNL